MTEARVVAFLAVLAVAGAAPARADHIRLIGGSEYESIEVTGVSDGQVIFMTSAGRELRKPLADVSYVELDTVPSLANLERLMSRGEYRKAAEGYERLRRSAQTTWQKRLIESRLLKAYDRQGRFDNAVDVYVELVQEMGATVEGLAPNNFPSPGSRFYGPALGAIERAAVANHVSAEARAALDRFAAAVRQAQAGSVAESAVEPQGDEAAAGGVPGGPPDEVSDTKGAAETARAALEAGRYEQAIAAADAALPDASTEARPELLYLKGVAEMRSARSRRSQLSAGLTLMRVVAVDEDSRFAAAALYEVGLLYEDLGRSDKALQLLEEAQGHPAADEALKADAGAAIARLRGEADKASQS